MYASGEIMTTYIVDYENEQVDGPFRNKDAIIQYLAEKLGEIEFFNKRTDAEKELRRAFE